MQLETTLEKRRRLGLPESLDDYEKAIINHEKVELTISKPKSNGFNIKPINITKFIKSAFGKHRFIAPDVLVINNFGYVIIVDNGDAKGILTIPGFDKPDGLYRYFGNVAEKSANSIDYFPNIREWLSVSDFQNSIKYFDEQEKFFEKVLKESGEIK